MTQQPNANTYEYLHDVLEGAILRLEGAARYSMGDQALADALRHIRGSLLQARAALASAPPIRTQADQKEGQHGKN